MVNAGANHVSPLLINTMNHRLNIKSEPISPTRDSHTPSNHLSLRPPSQNQGHLSPGHVSPHLSQSPTNCPSPSAVAMQQTQQQQHVAAQQHQVQQQQQQQHCGGGMSDYDGPMMKRQRVEGWTT